MNTTQHSQPLGRQWRTYLVGWLVCILVAALVYHYWPRGTRTKVIGAGTELATPLPAPPETPVASSTETAATRRVDSIDIKAAAISILLGANPQKWIVAQRDYLSRLDVIELWDVLTTAGVAEQTPSKALRESLLLGCSGYIQAQGSTSAQQDTSSPKVQCLKLLARGDKQYFRDQTLGLLTDATFNAAPSRTSGPDYMHLSGSQYANQESIELNRLTQNADPWLAARAVRDLISMQSTVISEDWSQYMALNEYEQDRMKQTLATDVACRMTNYCGADSPWTIQYCGLVRGTQCPAGMSFEDIAQLNLSQVELDLRQRILDNLSQRTAH